MRHAEAVHSETADVEKIDTELILTIVKRVNVHYRRLLADFLVFVVGAKI